MGETQILDRNLWKVSIQGSFAPKTPNLLTYLLGAGQTSTSLRAVYGMHCREILFTPRCSPRAREFPRSGQLCRAMLCISAAIAVLCGVRPSVRLSRSWIMSKRIQRRKIPWIVLSELSQYRPTKYIRRKSLNFDRPHWGAFLQRSLRSHSWGKVRWDRWDAPEPFTGRGENPLKYHWKHYFNLRNA